MRKLTLRKITFCAVLSALATLAFMLENLFPPIILPGARMGVSNVFILLATLMLGYKYGFICLAVKIINLSVIFAFYLNYSASPR
mgnify:CR=1 FL=1